MKSKNALRQMLLLFILFSLITIVITTFAYGAYGNHDGPYGENDGIHGGNCLSPENYPPVDSRIKGWATSVIDYWRPEGLTHGTPEIVLGQPGGTFHVLSLGDGGWIIVTFDLIIANGPGPDFVVWENGFVSRTPGFDPTLLWAELMFVEVSTDGDNFARFPSVCLNPEGHVGGFGCIDPTYYHNVAGKHPNGNDGRDEGTPFDLNDLHDDPLVIDGTVDLNNIRYVKLIDVVGDGSTFDSEGRPMLDPYPTPFGTGGADLDAVAVLNRPLPNQAPTADAGQNQTVDEGDTVTLDGSGSSDPDDGIVSYQWTQTAGPSVTLSGSIAAEATFTALDVGPGGETLKFELTVTDHGGLKDTDSVTVNIVRDNIPPTADAGSDQTVDEGDTVTLDGSGSSDPDDGIVSYQWTQTAGPSVTLSGSIAAEATFTAPDVGPGGETLKFELTVTDGGGLQSADTVGIEVTDDINEAPDQPLLSSPFDGEAGVLLRPELLTEAFSDPDNSNTHAGTEWQISRKSDFSSSVLVITSGFNLTSLTVPEPVLEGEVIYYWRARFYDESGGESEWSLSRFFTTMADTGDMDSNGVPDDQEVGETVDLDRNGIADREQGNIKSVNSVVGGIQVGVKTSQDVTIEALVSINSSDIAATAGRPSEMPFGLVSFKLKVENAGDIAEVTVYFSEAAPFDAEWFKYDEIIGWYDYYATYPNDDLVTFSNNRRSVMLRFKDGGFGDADGVKNGVIVDPGGVGYDSPSSVPHNGEASFEGVGGCFIATAAYGSYMEPGVKVLRDFRDTYLVHTRIGRSFVNAYYRYSPPIADYIAQHSILKAVTKTGLVPVVVISYVMLHTTAMQIGMFFLLLAGVSLIAWLILQTSRRKAHRKMSNW